MDLFFHVRVVFLGGHLIERFRIFILLDEFLVLIDADLDVVQFLIDLLGFFTVIPKAGLAHLVLELSDFFFFCRHLEGNLHLIEFLFQFTELGFQIFQHAALSGSFRLKIYGNLRRYPLPGYLRLFFCGASAALTSSPWLASALLR